MVERAGIVAMTPYLAAFAACLAGAVLEGALTGSGVKARFAELRMPAYSPSLPIWAAIGLAYYGLCFIMLVRLFAAPEPTALQWTAVALIGVVMFLNGLWNFVFFRRRSVRGSFLMFLPYDAVVLSLAGIMTVLDPFGAALIGGYGVYLVYVTWWTYRLWKLNEPAA
jgi:tryptophan-rich sensory protein